MIAPGGQGLSELRQGQAVTDEPALSAAGRMERRGLSGSIAP